MHLIEMLKIGIISQDMKQHELLMQKAIEVAKTAKATDDVPIGAIIVKDNEIIASACNEKEKYKFSTKHAEIIAIERAQKFIGDWRLNDCTMYVTLEPCAMCSGAIINARLSKLYFGAFDLKAGCCTSLYNLLNDSRFNHQTEVVGGVLEKDCGQLLSDFFKEKREMNRKLK